MILKVPPDIRRLYPAWIALPFELIVIVSPVILIVPSLLLSSESGSEIIPSPWLVTLMEPPFIVYKLSQANPLLIAVISRFPLSIVRVLFSPPFIPFFILHITFNFPSPFIVNEEDFLKFIPAPLKDLESSFNSLSVVEDSHTKIS